MIKSIIREAMDVYVCVAGKLSHTDIRDIIYVEHSSRSVSVYTLKGIIYIPYMPLKQVHQVLGNDYLFQCHRSFLVNPIHIESVNRTDNFVLLKNNMGKIPLGRKYKNAFLKEMHLI